MSIVLIRTSINQKTTEHKLRIKIKITACSTNINININVKVNLNVDVNERSYGKSLLTVYD